MKEDLCQRVYKIVAKIPKGKVSTYSKIASIAKTGPRVVGNILHQNSNPEEVPCHRIVNSKGYMAKNYAFGGAEAQRRRLENEGIKFFGGRVDMKCLKQFF